MASVLELLFGKDVKVAPQAPGWVVGTAVETGHTRTPGPLCGPHRGDCLTGGNVPYVANSHYAPYTGTDGLEHRDGGVFRHNNDGTTTKVGNDVR